MCVWRKTIPFFRCQIIKFKFMCEHKIDVKDFLYLARSRVFAVILLCWHLSGAAVGARLSLHTERMELQAETNVVMGFRLL